MQTLSVATVDRHGEPEQGWGAVLGVLPRAHTAVKQGARRALAMRGGGLQGHRVFAYRRLTRARRAGICKSILSILSRLTSRCLFSAYAPLLLRARPDGWGFQQLGQSAAEVGALKYQAISAIHAATYFQLPLIFINSLVIVVKLLFG